MSLRDCLNSAVEQGAIDSRQADELLRFYESRFTKKRPGMSEAEAARAARDELAADLRAEAGEKRRQVMLAEKARAGLATRLQDFDNIITPKSVFGRPATMLDAMLSEIIHYGYAGKGSMVGKANSIVAMAHRDLAEAMVHFRRSAMLGRRLNKADVNDLVRELEGEATGRPEIKALADAFANVMEGLRQRFNDAGGAIPKRKDFAVPHSHQAAEIRKLGADADAQRAAWKAIIKPLLEPELMTNPHTGLAVGAEGLDDALDHVFESIMSEGWAHRKPEARRFGQGALANRHQDGRFLIFRDAASWTAYNERFGRKDVIGTMFDHVKKMAHDIAAMETFGPNPDATIEWMKQAYAHEQGKAQAGMPAVVKALPGMDKVKWGHYRIDALWRHVRGRETVWNAPAQYAADIRNVATAAMLGSTSILAGATDPFISAASRRLAGLKLTRNMGSLVKAMASDKDRLAATRRAIVWDDFMHTMNENARLVDQVFGHEWSKYVVDRALTWNLLKPMTEARKRVEATAFHETLGGLARANTDWIDMPVLLQKTLEGFGLGADDWHRMRAGVDEIGFLDPGGVLDRTGDRQLAERYAEMIHQWSERAVPTGSIGAKSLLQGISPRGSVTGEVIDFATQFLSFGMSFTARQMEAVYVKAMLSHTRGGRAARGAGYFFALAIPLMMGAAFYKQVKTMSDGKDPADMTDPGFWAESFITGGGGGLFADFVQRSESRFGGSFQESLSGPGMAFVSDSLDLTLGNVKRILTTPGEDREKMWEKMGRGGTDYLGRYTPVLSSHPATRLAYRRYFIDNLQWLADPEADRSFKAKKARSSYWFEPGTAAPQRAPDLSTAFGN